MLGLRTFSVLCFVLALLLGACVEVTIPPEAGAGSVDGAVDGTPVPPSPGSNPIVDSPDAGGSGLITVDAGGTKPDEAEPLPESCVTHCDCPAGHDCINVRCVLGDELIQCCSHPDCPAGDSCWSADGQAGSCGAP